MRESDNTYRQRKTFEVIDKLTKLTDFINRCVAMGAGLSAVQLTQFEELFATTIITKGFLVESLVEGGHPIQDVAERLNITPTRVKAIRNEGLALRALRATAAMESTDAPNILKTDLKDTSLPVRVKNCMVLEKIKTVGELTSLTIRDLRRIPNLGATSIKTIEEFLKSHNIILKY